MALSAGLRSPQSTGCIAHLKTCLAAALLAVDVCGAHAEPAEYCVTCSGPDAQYRCTFSGDGATALRPGLQLYCVSTLAKQGKHETCSVNRAAKPPCTGVLKVLAMPDNLAPEPPAKTAVEPAPPEAKSDRAAGERTVPSSQGGPPSADVEAKASDSGAQGAKPLWHGKSANPSTTAVEAPQEPDANAAPSTQKQSAQNEPESTAPALMKPLENAGKTVGDAAKTTGSALEKAGSAVGTAAKKSWKCLTSLFGDC